MKKLSTIVLALAFGFAGMGQNIPSTESNSGNAAILPDQKLYLVNGKVSEKAPLSTSQKAATGKTFELNYFNVEFQAYGNSSTTLVPQFYDTFDDSSISVIGTSFSHIFDYDDYIFYGMDSISKIENVDYIIVDSIKFRFGHINHSGLVNRLYIRLKTLPILGSPTTGSLIWSDTVQGVDLTAQGKNFLYYFNAPVGDTLPYINRGVYMELEFDGDILDTGTFLINHMSSGTSCPATPGFNGRLESFTYREFNISEGFTHFISPWYDPNYYTNLQWYLDCNKDKSYQKGTNEAGSIQQVGMSVWFTYGGKFLSVNKYDRDLESLGQNYPNPFKNSTSINYKLRNSTRVALEVFDITGKSVQRIDEGYKSAGSYRIDLDGSQLNSGIYYYTLKTDAGQVTRKMIVAN